ncbi:MAG: tetratricopeptide repeat protein [bacterium]
MKNYSFGFIIISILAVVLFQGFQCGSPEFTGAKVYMQQKNFIEAKRLLEIEVKKNPQNTEAWYFLGGIYAEEGNYDGMNEAFNEVLKAGSVHAADIRTIRYAKWGQHLNAGVAFLERATADSAAYFEKSIKEFINASRAWPDTGLTYKYIAYGYNNKGDFDNAIVNFRKAWEMGKDVESIKRIGRIYATRGQQHREKFDIENEPKLKSIRDYAEAKRSTSKSEIVKWLGNPRIEKEKPVKGKKPPTKEEWFFDTYKYKIVVDGDKILEKQELGTFAPTIDSIEIKLAVVEFEKAVSALDLALKADPKDNESITLLMSSYVGTGRIKDAVKTFELAVANDQKNKMNHYLLGVLYREDGQIEKAIEQLKEMLKIDENDVEGLYELGATYYNWGYDIYKTEQAKGGELSGVHKEKFKLALPYLKKVSEHESRKNDPTIFETLGQIYAQLSEQEKAMKMFEYADWLKKNPLKIGLSEADIKNLWGEPDQKNETVYENLKSVQWTYGKQGALLYFTDGKLKSWTRVTK